MPIGIGIAHGLDGCYGLERIFAESSVVGVGKCLFDGIKKTFTYPYARPRPPLPD